MTDNNLDFLSLREEGNNLSLFFKSSWIGEKSKELSIIKQSATKKIKESKKIQSIHLDCSELKEWDTYFLAFLVSIGHIAQLQSIDFTYSNLPEKLEKLLDLALTVPIRKDIQNHEEGSGFLETIGGAVLAFPSKFEHVFSFLFETLEAFFRLFSGKSKMYGKDFWDALYECGANSLGIIALTSLLLGLILAFVGAIQLALFGAQVYVASFVGLSMVRIMGALLTGIVISGRTGASFAAILGTMQVNEEIDALQTFGISPYDFLVLPRVLALTLMIPLLTVCANLMGMFGGFIVGILMLDISPSMYIENTLQYMHLKYLWIGLFHAFVFGIVISLAGCYYGIRCGRSAEAVGQATTSSVVTSIVGIIISTSIITIVLSVLGI